MKHLNELQHIASDISALIGGEEDLQVIVSDAQHSELLVQLLCLFLMPDVRAERE